MKKLTILILVTLVLSCRPCQEKLQSEEQNITVILDNWHKAAATASYKAYFDVMSDKSIFIGTDAKENWNKEQFQVYAKPHFDKGKAWNFKAIERNIYFSENGKVVWFDELLSTQMKICRGSGVLALENGQWKIKHYVLSMTVPNENVEEIVKIKSVLEDKILSDKK